MASTWPLLDMPAKQPPASSSNQAIGPPRPPRLAIFHDLDAQLYPPELNEDEQIWRDRYSFFLDCGYQLRPRYVPEWTPSWIGTQLDPSYCEDAVEHVVRSLTTNVWLKLSEH